MVNTASSDGPLPTYFEHSWAILSSMGLVNVCFGFMVIGIVGFLPIAIVPIVVSTATALANGLCYFAFYTEYPKTNTIVASAFADVFWLIQEAGLSFYSYAILSKMLHRRGKQAFLSVFWALMLGIVALRALILIQRVKYLSGGGDSAELQLLINHLHMGYFVSIALIECISSVLLLLKFNSARRVSVKAALQSGTGVLFSYLMRSTEVRLALLAVIGVTRAVTYSSQATAQSASSTASQLDRFAYTLECTFPIMLLIDILASRLVYDAHNPSYHRSARSAPRTGHFTQTTIDDFKMYPLGSIERRIEVSGHSNCNRRQKSSSEENIIGGSESTASDSFHHHHHHHCHATSTGDILYPADGGGSGGQAVVGTSDAKALGMQHSGGISKTVEFNVIRADEEG
ncbi:hypothetical protein PG996_008664 [Apiospora saccharicola]|uniref:Uncharacterized protein n=1 Tax=Apiospora saccharicola TaxID=335842 RepID=A0ABR1UZ91_9PEZI